MSRKGTGKSVLITGCSVGGIGDALARTFHRRGCRVFATARDLAKLQHLKEMGITVLPLDVLEANSLKQAAETVRAATGGTLDILVNNSGIGLSMPLLDVDITEARKVFDTNVMGIILSVQAFAPLLIAAKGTIVNIGSITGVCPLPWSSVYNASKAAVNHLTDTLRLEMAPLGVNVILAITGVVKTKFFSNLPTRELPDGSIYAPGRNIVEDIMDGKTVEDSAMDVEVYAKDFVNNTLKSKPKVRYWRGALTGMIWTVNTFLWATAWDLLFSRSMKLGELKQVLKKEV